MSTLQALKSMSKGCNFEEQTAIQNRDCAICDTFIRGLLNGNIRQRLLENEMLDLQNAITQARALDMAQKNADSNSVHVVTAAAVDEATPTSVKTSGRENSETDLACISQKKLLCFFCGFDPHPCSKCPARELPI